MLLALAVPPPTPVSITLPSNGESVMGNIQISAKAHSATGIFAVQFILDGNSLLGSITGAPGPTYSIWWLTKGARNGTHKLTAVAVDHNGVRKLSPPVTVVVSNARVPWVKPLYFWRYLPRWHSTAAR